MTKKPVIVTDVDSVLLDWLQGFAMFLEKEKNIETNHVKQHFGTTEFICVSDITQIPCMDTNKLLIREYGKSGYLEELKAFQEEAVEHLKDLHKEVDFIALSCLSKNRKLIQQRERNLYSVYGDIFKDVICIGFNESKEHELARLNQEENVLTFIDDREKHIREAILAGVKPILFARGRENTLICPDNTFHTKHCWGEIKESVLFELDLKTRRRYNFTSKKSIDIKP